MDTDQIKTFKNVWLYLERRQRLAGCGKTPIVGGIRNLHYAESVGEMG